VKTEEALAACEETVRRFDADRYFAGLFAPAKHRPHLFVLFAFNYEVARLGERSHEPMLGAIRLQWWREAVGQARDGRPREHPVTIGLADLFQHASPSPALFEALFDGREFDLVPETFADAAALESYCEATSSGLMRMAADVLGVAAPTEPFLHHAGIAYAIAGLLRAMPFHAARRKLYLPLEALAAENVSAEEIFAGTNTRALKRVVQGLASRAHGHLKSARANSPHREALVAALPAALASLYLKRVTQADFDPFHDSPDVALFRRLLQLLRAATLGRM
jgi:phytoene/squalene synthetase